mgnify:CR=1 FL=1
MDGHCSLPHERLESDTRKGVADIRKIVWIFAKTVASSTETCTRGHAMEADVHFAAISVLDIVGDAAWQLPC